MKFNFSFLIAVLITLSSKVSAQLPGTLDLTFGTGGKVVYNRDQSDLYNDVQVQPDGKIVAAGTSMTPIFTAVIEVTRYLTDGSFDPSFGNNGHFNYTYNSNPETMAYRCLIKDNGKILITGHTTDYTTWGILLIQLNSDGTPDAAFGTNGVVFQTLSPGENAAFGLVLQTDDKILISGYKKNTDFNSVPVVLRFSASGVLDTSFGTNGIAQITVAGNDNDFSAVCVQPDGKILAAGHIESGLSWFTLLIARFDQNGILDPTYADAGIVNMNLGDVDDEFFDMKVFGNDCILTGFTVTQVDLTYHLLVMKFDQNGQPVATFGDGGKVIWGDVDYTFGDALEIQSDGRIVIAGCTGGLMPANNDWALWRFNADGTPDNNFGSNGVTTTDFFGGADEGLGVALWEDKIVVAGKIRNAADYLDFAVAKYWNSLTAAFTTSSSTICNGSTVQFTDLSQGDPNTWNWTFEGGTPSVSTIQNPLVTYSTPGVYDVTLVISKGTLTNTSANPDLIHVESPLTIAPIVPSGPTEICGSFDYPYTTAAVAGATLYNWSVNPASAGTISGTGLTGTLSASILWNGTYSIQVAASNTCGASPVSPALDGTLVHQPTVYSLFSGGGYCAGQSGYEIRLVDSETGVDYQLFKDGVASGSPLPGTGNLLSFGYQTVGTYTITGVNGICSATMQGASTNYLIDPPAAASQPSGPATTCNNVPSTFTGALPANGFTLVWTIDPPTAGTVTQPDLITALVTWNPDFAGSATVTVQGQNECGDGPSSPAHTITVNAIPAPVAAGYTTVCKTQQITYSTASNTGSTFVWAVTGGSITAGQGTEQIAVLWGNPGTGTVLVTETSVAGCAGTSSALTVAINECTGIAENQAEALNVYPNPASDQLSIGTGSQISGNVKFIIYNHLGQVVYQSGSVEISNSYPLNIDISNLNTGTYTLQVISETEVLYSVFVKK